jgi:hypothetical protein
LLMLILLQKSRDLGVVKAFQYFHAREKFIFLPINQGFAAGRNLPRA